MKTCTHEGHSAAEIQSLIEHSKTVRRDVLQMAARVKSSHIGGSFSVIDILVALYFSFLNVDPKNPLKNDRDRLIFSKGHCAAGLYATLAERGFCPKSALADYFADGKLLTGHPTRGCLPGVETSTGSLGHGLPIGSGIVYGARKDGMKHRAVVVMSDGECNEGSVWESALLSGHLKLENLIAVVDYNKLQGFGRTDEVASLEPFADKWRAFGWAVREIDGHDFCDILNALHALPFAHGKPNVIIAHTVKGKGVSFMENSLDWHYKYPQGEEVKKALEELA